MTKYKAMSYSEVAEHAGIVFRNTTKSRCSHIFIGRYCRKRKLIKEKKQKKIKKEKGVCYVKVLRNTYHHLM